LSCGLGDEAFDRFPRSAALVAVAEVGPFAVVVIQPGVEIGMEPIDARVEAWRAWRAGKLGLKQQTHHGTAKALIKGSYFGSCSSLAAFDLENIM
jgi:hypothetical protein